MEAPKEIYIPNNIDLVSRAILTTATKEDDIKYIRADKVVDKDALMETLREKRAAITECSATNDRKVAALSVIDFLISKINEL